MTFFSFLFQTKTFIFFAIVFSLLYLVPDTLISKKKMKKWALVISLAYILFTIFGPFFLFFFNR